MEDLLPADDVVLGQALAGSLLVLDVRRQGGFEEGADFFAERLLFRGVFEVHASRLLGT
ncbi:hypothetical protein D3C87_2073320 [compost metagenome]